MNMPRAEFAGASTASNTPGRLPVQSLLSPNLPELQHQLLQRIGREIRAPLGAVIGFAQLMSHDQSDPLGERHRRWTDLIEQAAHYMLALVNDTMELADPSSAAAEVGPLVEVPLALLMHEVHDWLKADAERRGVSLHCEAAEVTVRADPRRLRQVLLNLVSNGIKYNRPGGKVTLRVEPAATQRSMAIVVEDTGRGMNEAMRARLFEPYNRLGREDSGIEGTGLGLCIVRELVQAMGGSIEVRSIEDVGSDFRVTLPLA
jgi:signal transduction histidine kinase